MTDTRRLAIITSHPIPYFAPLWRALAREPGVSVRVLYASRQGATRYFDRDLACEVKWDVPLLDGYPWTLLENRPLPTLGWRFRYRCPAIEQELAGGGYDAVLLVGKEFCYYLQAIRAARRLGIPILYRADTPPPRAGGLGSFLAQKLRTRLFRRCAAVLLLGCDQSAFYARYGVSEERMFRSPYCVDNGFFRAEAARYGRDRARHRAALGFDVGTRVVAWVAKFTAVKRPRDMLDAFERLAARGDYGLVMTGSGPLLEECRRYAAERGLERVVFTGFRNQTEIGAVYAAADVFALTSAHETWGLVVNEAMNFGLPVVVSDRVGCGPDLVAEGENGFRYPRGDVAALSDRLARVLADDETRAAMGRRSRAIVEGFGIDQAVAGIRDALTATVNGSRRN